MKTYYEVQVKYEKLNPETSKYKKVTESYLVNAVSFGDAEIKISKIMSSRLSGEFEIKADRIVNYAEILNVSGETYYKSKIIYLSIDNKIIAEYVLIKDSDIPHAVEFLRLANCDRDAEIVSVSKTKIKDVFD